MCGESVATATSPVVNAKFKVAARFAPPAGAESSGAEQSAFTGTWPTKPKRQRTRRRGQRPKRNLKAKKKTTNGVEVVAFDRNSIPPRSVSAIRPTPLRHRPATRRGGAGNGRRALKSESTPISRSSSFTCFFFLLFRLSRTDDGAESRPRRRRRRRRRVKPRRPATSTTDAMAVAVVVATPHLRRRRLVLLASLFVLLAATPSSLPSASGRSIHSQCSILMNEPSFISFLSFYLV